MRRDFKAYPDIARKGPNVSDMVRKNDDLKYELIAETVPEYPSEPPLHLVHRAFRGRYRMVIAAAASLAILGGLIGSRIVPPKYQSTGLVKVEGVLPAILYDSRENAALPMFNAYVASQVTFLQSRPVLDAAVRTPEMQLAGWPAGPRGVARLQSALTVQRGRGEQIISVSVRDTDPRLAQTAVNAVLGAFQQECENPGGLTFAAKERILVEREQHLQEELQELREQMLLVSEHYGREAIERMHANKIGELLAIDEKLAELEAVQSGLALGEYAEDLNLTEVVALPGADRQFSALEQEEMELVAELKSLQPKYGPNHPMMRELNRRLEAIRIRMDLRDRSMADLAGGPGNDAPGHSALMQASRDRLDQRQAHYRTLRERIRREVEKLGGQQVVLTGLNERAMEIRNHLQATRQRLDELRVETSQNNLNRVSIAARGDLPVAPIHDRRAGLAAAFALFGAVFGTAGVFFLGLRDRRARYIDELETLDETIPIIGVLPELAGDKQSERRSARSVHQLRNLLEVQCPDPQSNVLAVTSCDRGEGKTSLALALASSLAGAGRKTLVIDADIARRSLTRELALENVPGLCEAIGPRNASGQVHRTRQANLWALPIGGAHGLRPEDLSRHRLEWLLDALRSRFDAIIVDTGPLLTSIEAALVSAVSDRVILLVGRNQRLDLVQSSLARLEQVGADCAGLVFNRASESDCGRYEAASCEATSPIARLVPGTRAAGTGAVAPLAGEAAMRFPSPDDGTEAAKRAA